MNAGNSTPPSYSSIERPPVLKSAIAAWNRFWFTPADPTLLAVIRITCGMLALYTILAYTLDLYNIFGKDGLLNLDLRLKYVREMPWALPPLNWPREDSGKPPAFSDAESDYITAYKEKHGVAPPLPFPKTKEEADYYDNYRYYWGVDPRSTIATGAPVWSIWFHVTDPPTMMAIHIVFVLATFLLMIGFATRITSVLSWFAALCYIHRGPSTLFGVDTMMLIVLMYLMIAPCGATLSVDSWLARWWRRRRARAEHADPEDIVTGRPKPRVSANVALRLLQIHVCIIYAAAGLAKLKGSSWWNGEAVWGTLANYEFVPMYSPLYMSFIELLSANQVILKTFLFCGTYFTLFFEIAYPFMIWNRWTRWLMLFMAIVLHGVIGMIMGLRTFAFMMLIMNMAFVPTPVLYWVGSKFKNLFQRLRPKHPGAGPSSRTPKPVAAGVADNYDSGEGTHIKMEQANKVKSRSGKLRRKK